MTPPTPSAYALPDLDREYRVAAAVAAAADMPAPVRRSHGRTRDLLAFAIELRRQPATSEQARSHIAERPLLHEAQAALRQLMEGYSLTDVVALLVDTLDDAVIVGRR